MLSAKQISSIIAAHAVTSFFARASMQLLLTDIAIVVAIWYMINGITCNRSQLKEEYSSNLKSFLNCVPDGVLVVENLKPYYYNDELVNILSSKGMSVDSQQLSNVIKGMLVSSDEKGVHKIPLLVAINSLDKCDYFGFIDENVYFLIRIRQYHDVSGNKTIIFVKDIRRIKDLEESVEFTNYKNLLVASASHEFRTPLNGILGMLTLLNLFVSEEGKHLLKVASDSSNFLMCLINDMLDFSQLESKSLKINYSSFDVKKMLEEIRDLVSYQPQSRGVSLILEISDKVPK